MVRIEQRLAAVLATVFVPVVGWADPPPKSAWANVPTSANTVVAIDVDGLFASPLGQKNGWREARAKNQNAPLDIPGLATSILLAAEVDFRAGTPIWELSTMHLKEPLGINTLAAAEGGRVDQLAGQPIVVSPRDLLFTVAEPANVVGIYPADRQRFARFLRGGEKGPGSENSLVQAVEFVAKDGQIAIALNLQDIVDTPTARTVLASMPTLKDSPVPLDTLAPIMASIQGVVIGVHVGETIQGKVVVEFGQSTDILASVGKSVFLGILERKGAMIDGVKNWSVKAGSGRVEFAGTLEEQDLRDLLSLFQMPSTRASSNSPAAAPSKADASKTYFADATKIINGLRGKRGAGSLGEYALWYETYARKLDNLPLLNVDEDLVQWAHETSDRMRAIAAAYRSVGPNVAIQAGSFGEYDSENSFYDVRRQGRGQAGLSRVEIWNEIDQSVAAARKAMTQRYGVEF